MPNLHGVSVHISKVTKIYICNQIIEILQFQCWLKLLEELGRLFYSKLSPDFTEPWLCVANSWWLLKAFFSNFCRFDYFGNFLKVHYLQQRALLQANSSFSIEKTTTWSVFIFKWLNLEQYLNRILVDIHLIQICTFIREGWYKIKSLGSESIYWSTAIASFMIEKR